MNAQVRVGRIFYTVGPSYEGTLCLPPLIVTPEQVDAIAEVFEAGVRAAGQGTEGEV